MNNMNKIIICSCTKKSKEDFFKTSLLAESLNKLNIDFDIKYNNTNGLCKNYNIFIKKYKNKYKTLVLVHDDVRIEDLFFEEKIEKGLEKFNILGVAGTNKWSLSNPAIWNNPNNKEDWSGIVNHTNNAEIWSSCFGVTPKKCIILDGVILAIDLSKIDKCLFDERFTFHHYDLDFSLTANLIYKLSLGTFHLNILHNSLGEWRNNKVWEKSNIEFLNKWKDF